MDQTLSDRVIEAPRAHEFQYRYRAYTPSSPVRALVAYLPQYGDTLDAGKAHCCPGNWQAVELPAWSACLSRRGPAT